MARDQPCDPAVTQGQLAYAQTFLQGARFLCERVEGDDEVEDGLSFALVMLWVHAGTAAADVICCLRLSRYHVGPSHQKAIELLRSADRGSEEHLRRLLDLKAPAGYGHRLFSSDDRVRARRAAEALVNRAEELRASA